MIQAVARQFDEINCDQERCSNSHMESMPEIR